MRNQSSVQVRVRGIRGTAQGVPGRLNAWSTNVPRFLVVRNGRTLRNFGHCKWIS
jgi:hypothetical protein